MMEAVGQRTRGIAHDFNDLLGIIMGNPELLESYINDSAKAVSHIESALKGVIYPEYMKKLTAKAVLFGRLPLSVGMRGY